MLYSPCCGLWTSVIMLSLCCSCIRKQGNDWPVTLKLWGQMWVRRWKTPWLRVGLFFISCTGLNSRLLESSRSRFQHRGQFPCISPSPSTPLLLHLPQACVCLKGGLTHSFTAMQPHHLSSSQWQASPPHHPPPSFNPSKTRTSSAGPHRVLAVSLAANSVYLFIHRGDNADEGVTLDRCNAPHCLICRSRPLERETHGGGGWLLYVSIQS